jgi:hypothetical protein
MAPRIALVYRSGFETSSELPPGLANRFGHGDVDAGYLRPSGGLELCAMLRLTCLLRHKARIGASRSRHDVLRHYETVNSSARHYGQDSCAALQETKLGNERRG